MTWVKCPLKTVASSWSPFCYRTTAKLAGGVATKLTRLVPLASCAEDPSMTLVWWKKEGTYCNAQSMGKIKPNTVTMEDFLHPTFMNKSFRPYGKKNRRHCTVAQMDLIDIYRTFHLTTAEYIVFIRTWTLLRLDHILGHKTNVNKCSKNWNHIIYCFLSIVR